MRTTRRIRDLPGPRGLPILGNLLQVDTTRLHLIAEQWSRTYGDYFRFRIGPRQLVVLANPETIATVLRDRPDGFNRTSRLSSIAKEMGFEGVFSANGESWRRQRPMVMASFDPGHIKSYFPGLVLQADLMRYTVDVTAGLAFGADINTLESDEEVIQAHLDKIFPALFTRLMAPFPYWRWFRDRALDRHLEALHRAVEGFIARARARLEAGQPGNLIEAMIVARDEQGSGLDDADVAGNVLTMLLAGEDTTANTLAWMIYLLSRHPDALARARGEVRALLGKDSILQKYEDVAALAFLEACANETMRLKPVAPIIMLEATRDTVVAGIEVPAGTLLMCLMRAGPTDERRFADAHAFDPARWLSGASTTPDGQEAKEHLAFTMAPVGCG